MRVALASTASGEIHSRAMEAVERVLRSGRYILGEEVEAFEQEVAQRLDVEHALGVSSGTDALLVSLMALELGPGDEVITTAFSFVSTVECILRVGATPVFVDVDPATFNLDVAHVARAVSSRTRAVIPVHLFGHPVDVPRLRQQVGPEVAIVEDAAQAFGATQPNGKGDCAVGTLGNLGCFSFFPTKNLGGFGDGGLVVTSDAALASKLRSLRSHGAGEEKFLSVALGGNFRLDALQAALLRVRLGALGPSLERRRQIANGYGLAFAASGLVASDLVSPPRIGPGHGCNQYVVRVPGSVRADLQGYLHGRGIASAVYYPRGLHEQPMVRRLVPDLPELPHTEKACSEVLALPMHSRMGQGDVHLVVEAVQAFFDGRGP